MSIKERITAFLQQMVSSSDDPSLDLAQQEVELIALIQAMDLSNLDQATAARLRQSTITVVEEMVKYRQLMRDVRQTITARLEHRQRIAAELTVVEREQIGAELLQEMQASEVRIAASKTIFEESIRACELTLASIKGVTFSPVPEHAPHAPVQMKNLNSNTSPTVPRSHAKSEQYVNPSFLITLLALPVPKLISAVLFVGAVLALSLGSVGLGYGLMLGGLGLFATNALFTGNRNKTEETSPAPSL